jgi:predicted TIM-barrel fold metal-dependent hydrolase
MNRRTFLKSASAVTLAAATRTIAAPARLPVIDTHIHLFDPARPGGVPWPEKSDDKLYRPALPGRYAQLAEPHGIIGAIAIECSPWLIDNFWLHDVVESSPLMLGFVGDLDPAAPDFAATLDRLHRSPLFLGIRYGNLWKRNPFDAAHNPQFIAGLKLLAEAGLVLDTANPDPELLSAVLEISNRVPNLRVVIDHLPHADTPGDANARSSYDSTLRELTQHPHIFIKGSEILRTFDGSVSFDLARYKDNLDQLWALFGEDRMLFGSDWPNSDTLADYGQTFSIARRYIATRSAEAQEKYFWKNSLSAYKWRARSVAQAGLTHAAVAAIK